MNIQGKVWGETVPLFNQNNVEVHFVKIKKGGYCSKHCHKAKYNKFLVLHGELKVSIWKDYGTETLEDISIVRTGQECTVSPGDFHRFEAIEDTQALEIYWVDLRVDDIVRQDHGGMKADETKTINRDDIASGDHHPSLSYNIGTAPSYCDSYEPQPQYEAVSKMQEKFQRSWF